MMRLTCVSAVCVLAALGCKQDVDLGGEFRTVLDVEPEPITALDILFVVDNSGSMGDEQVELVDAVGDYMFATLAEELGELPDMHIGVVSTDVGAGPYNISGCSGPGDNGLLQAVPRRHDCTPPANQYLKDSPDPAGGRVTNYEGTLTEAFSCIARLGIDGCGFEQPLESARRAVDGRHPENDGFLRDDALLLLVVLTDEDDCSAFDTVMFDTSQNDVTDPLGPLSSYRCFEFGVECDQDPRSIGERTNCRPREDSEYMTSIGEFADFFRGVKASPSHVAVSIISGGTGPISTHDGRPDRYYEYPDLDPVCERSAPSECEGIVWPIDAGPPDAGPPAPPGEPADAGTGLTPQDCQGGGSTYPAVRLNAFLEAFPGRAHFTSMCDFTMAMHLESTARLAADVMGRSPCLRGALVDADRGASGIQPKCRGYEVTGQQRVAVPSCAETGGAMPCFALAESTECEHHDTKLAAQMHRPADPAAPTHFVVECLAPLTP